MRRYLPLFIAAFLGSSIAFSQSLTVVSGNGQIVLEQFLTSIPLTAVARDGSGNPIAGIPITWTITQGQGTIVRPSAMTDSNGLASADFLGTAVPNGLSYSQVSITASSSLGSVTFYVTTTISRLPGGGNASLPLVELITPSSDNRRVTGRANGIIPGAVVLRVSIQSGPQTGQFIPNVGVVIHFYNDDEPQPAPFASCRGNVVTNSAGVATCDLVLNDHLGQVQLKAVAGEAQSTPPFLLTIQPGAACTYSIASPSQSFNAVGGTGTINLTTQAACNWAAASNASWVVITGPVAGTTSANIGYAVATNSGPARSAAITVGSQVFTVNQAAAGAPSPLAITSTTLPTGALGTQYSASMLASGGTPTYHWRSSTLPPGLTINDAGLISGVPTVAGTFSMTAIVTDSAAASASQTFTITVSSTPTNTSGPQITTSSFVGGTVGQTYGQNISYTTYCTSPFSKAPTITLSAGSLPPGLTLTSPTITAWSVTGTPTTPGTSSFTLTITEPACAKSSSSNFSIAITGSNGGGGGQPNGVIIPAPNNPSFTVSAGSTTSSDTIVNLTSSTGTVLPYTASILPGTGGQWLSISDFGTGQTPASLRLTASNFQTLTAGTYSAQVSLQVSGYPVVYIQVTLNVVNSSFITVSPSSLVFTSPALQFPLNIQQFVQITSPTRVHFDVGFATDFQNNWLGVTPGSGFTSTPLTVLVNPANLKPGTYTGKILITPTGGAPVSIPVTLIVTQPPALSWSVPAVDNSYLTDGPTPLSITVNLASSSSTLPYRVLPPSASWLSVTPSTGLTPDNITLSFDPTGLVPGVYQTQLTAASAGATGVQPVALPITFSVRQSAPTISAIVNAASLLPGALAPGMEVQITGSSLGPLTQVDATPDENGLYPTSLAEARVLFDDFTAPVLHASDNQITVLVPYSVAGKSSVHVVAQYRFAQSVPQIFNVADSNPGIFTAGGTQGVVFNEDGTANSLALGANPGSVVGILGTGEGQTNPPGIDGLIMLDGSLASPVLQVTAQINGEPADIISATSAPGQPAGVFLIKVKVPDDAPRGMVVPVSVTIGTASSQSGVTMVIAQ